MGVLLTSRPPQVALSQLLQHTALEPDSAGPAGEESGADDGAEDEGEDAEYGTKSGAKSAAFWEDVLRHHHNRLQQAEEAALAQAPTQPRRAAAAVADSMLPHRGVGQAPPLQVVGSGLLATSLRPAGHRCIATMAVGE